MIPDGGVKTKVEAAKVEPDTGVGGGNGVDTEVELATTETESAREELEEAAAEKRLAETQAAERALADEATDAPEPLMVPDGGVRLHGLRPTPLQLNVNREMRSMYNV